MNSTVSINNKVLLGVKTFPIFDGKVSLAEFSSGGLDLLVKALQGSFKPLLEIVNLQEFLARIDSELERFQDATQGPPKFQLYLSNLREMKKLLSQALAGENPQSKMSREKWSQDEDEEIDFSSPKFRYSEEYPKLKDHKKAIAQIRSYLDEKTACFVQSDLVDFGDTMIMHLNILNAFARIDMIQQENSNETVVVETSFEPKEEKIDKEIPIQPNNYEIKINDHETYAIYVKVKDAIMILEKKYKKHNIGKVPPMEPQTEIKKISDRVKDIIDIEKRILGGNISTKDLGSFGWYSVKAKSIRRDLLWRRPSEVVLATVPQSFGGKPKGDTSNGSGKLSRKREFLNLLKN